LLPKSFRRYYKKLFEGNYYENRLLQHFRARAMAYGETPHRDETDQWLFLAQHVGLPTRLLDWTESGLAALYFALQEREPVVWMLNPFGLNNIVLGRNPCVLDYNIYALKWFPGFTDKPNIGHQNIGAAWEQGKGAAEMPVAIAPTYIDARVPAQKSRFTVHGRKEKSLCELLAGKEKCVLKKYVIDGGEGKQSMLDQLQVLGVSRSALFPDLDKFGADLTEVFRPDLANWIQRD
jgi:hypothetical protein